MAFNIIRAARIAVLRDQVLKLDAFLSDLDYEPTPVYHLSGFDEDFCFECAEDTANEAHANNGSIDPQSHPHEAFEREEPVRCDRCQKLLDYSLSPAGAVVETKVWTRNPFRGALLPAEAFQVHQILMSLHDLARFGTNDDIDEVWSDDYRNAVTLGEAAIAAIRIEPEQLDLFGDSHGEEANIPGSQRGSSPHPGPY